MKDTEHNLRDRVRWFAEKCRDLGIKATHQRTEIFRELARSKEHPDAEAVYRRVRRRFPAISLDTVYRNLRMLEARGVVRQVGVAGHRMRFDADTAPHHHFVCTSCGRIQDFLSATLDGLAAPANVLKMGHVDSIHLELRGVCRSCQRK